MLAAKNKYYLPDIVGKHYKEFWHFKGRYRVCKGSRASKKSKTTALWYIYNLMKNPQANLLVIRKVFRTLKDSCFTELKWAINRLGVSRYWKITESPLEMTYIPTGQTIYFRGLDDPLKITSITVETGYLCWSWIEEAYEISKEADFDILDESLRGMLPDGLFYQWTLTFNPWNQYHWIKKRFFDTPSPNILAKTTNYMMNEFLDPATLSMFEEMRTRNPKRYRVAGLGEWGTIEGHIYEMFSEANMFDSELLKTGMRYIAIDYGTVNPMVFLDIWHINGYYYLLREYYYSSEIEGKQKTDSEYREDLKDFIGDTANHNHPVFIVIDPSAASFKVEVRKLRLRQKDADNSVLDGIRLVQDLFEQGKLFIHKSCTNTIKELTGYRWNKKSVERGKEEPIKVADHAPDALRYFCKTIVNPKRI